MYLSIFSFRCTNHSGDSDGVYCMNTFCEIQPNRQKFYKTSHQILQIHCCMSSKSHLCGADFLPWLECPCRDSCTLGIWDHTDTSSHCPCRWTPPLNCKQYSSEQPGQNVLADTQVGWPEDLEEIEYYVIKCKGMLEPSSFPNLCNKQTNYEKWNYMAFLAQFTRLAFALLCVSFLKN